MVIVDSRDTLDYVLEYDGITILQVDKLEAYNELMGMNPNTGKPFPYNLYINQAYEHIEDGYFYGIDDDDYLAYPEVISDLLKVADTDTLVLGRMQHANGKVIPEDNYFGKKPQICHIGGSCMFFHSKWFSYAQFDGWKCSDFRVINRLHNVMPNVHYYNKVIMKCGNNGGHGLNKDI